MSVMSRIAIVDLKTESTLEALPNTRRAGSGISSGSQDNHSQHEVGDEVGASHVGECLVSGCGSREVLAAGKVCNLDVRRLVSDIGR